jgi:hypothetical protein
MKRLFGRHAHKLGSNIKRRLKTYGASDDWIQLAQNSVQFSWTQYANKPQRSIDGDKFLDQLSEYTLGQDSAPWSCIIQPGHTASAWTIFKHMPFIWHQNIIKYLFSTRLCRHILWRRAGLLLVVCFLLGNSPESEFYMPKFRNTLFHLHRQVGE